MRLPDPDSSKKSLFALLIVLVTFATVVLGIMQYTWISRAATVERTRHLSGVFRDSVRAVNGAFDELRLIVSLIRTAAGNTDIQSDGDSADAILESWRDQALFPGFVKGVWIRGPGGEWIFHAADGAGAPEPPEVIELLVPAGHAEEPGIFRERAISLGLQGYSVVPYDAGGMAVLELDTDLFLGEMLPYYLSNELSGYEYRVFRSGPDARPPEPPDRREPPAKTAQRGITLHGISLAVPGFYLGEPEEPDGQGKPEKHDDPFPGILLSRMRDGDRTAVFGTEGFRIPENLQLGQVEVRFSEGALDRDINRWIFLNSAASAGVLCLLLLCLLGVYALYRRTGAIRLREQEFVAFMSHELRLPVTVIRAIADNLASGIVLSPERLKLYGIELGSEAGRLTSTVEGILLYSGLQSGNRRTEFVPVSIRDLTAEAVNGMKEVFERNGIRFDCTINAGIGDLAADAKGIRTIMENLLMNAALHGMPRPEGEEPRVRLLVSRHPFDILRIIVEDNGPGIPRREQRKVFLPFVRSERTVRSQNPGSGLGLHIVRRIAQLNGGSVVLESPYADSAGGQVQGCRFTVTVRTAGVKDHA